MCTYWIRTARRVIKLGTLRMEIDRVAPGQIRWAAGADPTSDEIINLERCTAVLIDRFEVEKNVVDKANH
jgi:hypothetical protein